MSTALAPVSAVRTGTLPGGLDCYILEDGERILSNRGILHGIRPEGTRGHGRGDLGQYLARLPKRYADLTRGHDIEFRAHDKSSEGVHGHVQLRVLKKGSKQ